MIAPILKQEIKLAFTQGSGILPVLMFFIITVTLFAFAFGPEKNVLASVAPGVIWVCALLAVMLSLPPLFARDFEDGTLESLLLQGYIPERVVFAKLIAHWLLACLPLILLSPVLGYMLQMESENLYALTLSLAAGTPTLSLVGGLGAALTLGTRRAAALLGLLVLPLYIPILIFGIAATSPQTSNASFWVLLGFLFFMLPVSIFSCTLAVKSAVED